MPLLSISSSTGRKSPEANNLVEYSIGFPTFQPGNLMPKEPQRKSLDAKELLWDERNRVIW